MTDIATPTTLKPNPTGPALVPAGWSSLSGRILSGGFELQEMLEADETRARFKVRVLGDRELDCVALIFRIEGPGAEQQLELWNLTRHLRHPAISAPLGAGPIEGWPAIYCVVRRADESLDAVLGDRALTAAEAGEALESVARALETLHSNGMAFGCLSPSRILAVGESIKVPAECVRPLESMPPVRVFPPSYLAPESAGIASEGRENITSAADLWCLGATFFEALRQKAWSEKLRGEAGDLPEPFASIVLRCVQDDPASRATLGEVMALFRGEMKPLPRTRASTTASPAGAQYQTFAHVPSRGLVAQDETHVAASSAAVSEPAPLPAEKPFFQTLAPQHPAETQQAVAPFEASPELAPSAIDAEPRRLEFQEAAERASVPLPPAPPLTRPEPAQSAAVDDSASLPLVGRSGRLTPTYRSGLDEALENRSVRRRATLEDSEEPATSLWVWAGILLLIVFGLIWALRPKAAAVLPPKVTATSGTRAGTNHSSAVAAPGKSAGTASSAWQTQTLQPDGSVVKSTPGGSESSGKSASSGVTGAAVWRVVSFTYLHREDAQKKAQNINARHGSLHATVFSPSGSGAPFLVVLGGRVTREEAAQLKRKAVSDGLPRDSYIQNYSH